MQTNFLENMQIHKYKPGDVLVRHISREHLDQLSPQVGVELRLNVESGGGHSWIVVVKITLLITCSYMWRLEQCHQGRGSTGPVPVLIMSKRNTKIVTLKMKGERELRKYCFCHLVELLNEGLVLDRVEVWGPLGQPGPTQVLSHTQNIYIYG